MLAAAMLASALAAPTAAQRPSDPEAHALALINEARADLGRVALRWDGRLADIAQDRSDYMAATGDFSHKSLGTMMAERNVTWSYLAEVLVHGTPRTPMESAEEAVVTWRNSKAHWDLLSDVQFNYIGLAVARASDGWYYWTGVIIRGPDRTKPTASLGEAAVSAATTAGTRGVTVSWRGADVPLSVNTAGLRDFKLQRKVNSGNWVTVGSWSTATSRSFDLTAGNTYRFRVRSRDWNGNRSAWTAAVTVTP